jgi:hypothetical protein
LSRRWGAILSAGRGFDLGHHRDFAPDLTSGPTLPDRS